MELKPQEIEKTTFNFDLLPVDFSDVKQGIILHAYLHDQESCVTIVRQGNLALTFKKNEENLMVLKHYITSSLCRGVKVGEDLYIEGDINILEEFEKHKGKNRM